MDFAYDDRTLELRKALLDFMATHVHLAEPIFHEQLDQLDNRWAWDSTPVLTELRVEACRRGLWNLFLPGDADGGLTNLQYAPQAEITGRSMHLAPPALNCAAPEPAPCASPTDPTKSTRTRWPAPNSRASEPDPINRAALRGKLRDSRRPADNELGRPSGRAHLRLGSDILHGSAVLERRRRQPGSIPPAGHRIRCGRRLPLAVAGPSAARHRPCHPAPERMFCARELTYAYYFSRHSDSAIGIADRRYRRHVM
jgi:hypothetical protein